MWSARIGSVLTARLPLAINIVNLRASTKPALSESTAGKNVRPAYPFHAATPSQSPAQIGRKFVEAPDIPSAAVPWPPSFLSKHRRSAIPCPRSVFCRSSNQGGEAAPNAELRPGKAAQPGDAGRPWRSLPGPRAFLISAIDNALRRRELAQIESSVKIRSPGVGAPGSAWCSALIPRVPVRHCLRFPAIWLWLLG